VRRALLWLILGGCTDPTAPHIDRVVPGTAPVGAIVTIEVDHFCGPAGSCDPLPVGSVSFGIDPQIRASIRSWRADRIEAQVPAAAAGPVLVVVTVDGRSSNGVSFHVQ
jgi:hypothetical protein